MNLPLKQYQVTAHFTVWALDPQEAVHLVEGLLRAFWSIWSIAPGPSLWFKAWTIEPSPVEQPLDLEGTE